MRVDYYKLQLLSVVPITTDFLNILNFPIQVHQEMPPPAATDWFWVADLVVIFPIDLVWSCCSSSEWEFKEEKFNLLLKKVKNYEFSFHLPDFPLLRYIKLHMLLSAKCYCLQRMLIPLDFMCVAIQKQKSIMLHLHKNWSICVHVEFWTIDFPANAVCEVEQEFPNSYHQSIPN